MFSFCINTFGVANLRLKFQIKGVSNSHKLKFDLFFQGVCLIFWLVGMGSSYFWSFTGLV